MTKYTSLALIALSHRHNIGNGKHFRMSLLYYTVFPKICFYCVDLLLKICILIDVFILNAAHSHVVNYSGITVKSLSQKS